MKLRVAVALFGAVAILAGCTSPGASTVGGTARREPIGGGERAGRESIRERAAASSRPHPVRASR